MKTTTAITITRAHLPSVTAVEAAPTGRQVYARMDDGRSVMVDLSGWKGYLRGKWDEEGFYCWRVDDGLACWGEDGHICPDFCSEEMVEMSYEEWLSACGSVFAVQRGGI